MTKQIGYATTATEAQKLREEFDCIVLIELGTDNSVLKSIAASLKDQDVFISSPENLTVQAYIPALKQNGVKIRTPVGRHLSRPTNTFVKGKGLINPEESDLALPDHIAKAAKREELKAKRVAARSAPTVGRPRAAYINEAEIVKLYDQQGMSFRDIARLLSDRVGFEVSPSVIHSAYRRAKLGKG